MSLKKQYPGLVIIGPRADEKRIPGIDEKVGDGDVFNFGSHQVRRGTRLQYLGMKWRRRQRTFNSALPSCTASALFPSCPLPSRYHPRCTHLILLAIPGVISPFGFPQHRLSSQVRSIWSWAEHYEEGRVTFSQREETLICPLFHILKPPPSASSHSSLSGDTLFALGCGRLFEADPKMMWTSLQKLLPLPDETKVRIRVEGECERSLST